MPKRFPKLLIILIVFVFMLAACQPALPAEEVEAPAEEEAAPAEEEAAPAEEEAAPAEEEAAPAEEEIEPAPSGELAEVPREETVIFDKVFGRTSLPDNFNPYIPGHYTLNGQWQLNLESLFYHNFETGELMPWLAESYEYNDDFTEVTIFLREGVEWSDGMPFTADDVVFTVNMMKETEGLYWSGEMSLWVEDVEAVDDHTVLFTFTETNPRFVMNYFGVRAWDVLFIAPKHVWEGQDPTTFKNFDLEQGWPVGTGPYRLVRSTETETVWDRRDDYWAAETGFAPMPVPRRAIWVFVGTEETRAAMLDRNELDGAYAIARGTFETLTATNPNIIAWYEEPPYGYFDSCARSLVFNTAYPFMDNPDVRWAVNYAIDRDALIEIVYEGITEPQAFATARYTPLESWFDRNQDLADRVLQYDPATSEELMTGAGFTKDNEGFWVNEDGQRVEIPLTTYIGSQDSEKALPVIIQQLRDAGFDASGQPQEWAVYIDRKSRGDIAGWYNFCGSVADPVQTLSLFHGQYAAPLGEPSPNVGATSRYANPEFDALVDQLTEMSPQDPAFNDLVDEATQIWLNDLPVAGIVQNRYIVPYNETYWTNWPTADNNYIYPLAHWFPILHIVLGQLESSN